MDAQQVIARASELLSRGEFAQCAALTAELVSREPNNAVAAHLLGLALKDAGDFAQGEQWLRHSLRLDPHRAEFHFNLANLLRRQEKYVKAERVFRRGLSLAPENRAARRGLALTLGDLQRPADARLVIDALLAEDAGDAEAWVIAGLVLSQLEHFVEAEAAYRRAIALRPGDRVAHHNLGALLSRLQKPEAAIAALSSAQALGADGFELAFNQGRTLLDLNDIAGAEREFERAAAARPTHAEAQLNLARVRYMMGDEKFARSIAVASAAHRGDLPLQLLFAEVLWRAGSADQAEALLQDLAHRLGPHPLVLSNLAAVQLERGLLAEAERNAIDAVKLQPDDASLTETLVSVLLSRGRPDDALKFILTHRQRLPESQAWVAYEATAARALNPARYAELYDYDRLVQIFDLPAPPGFGSIAELNAALKASLGERHRFRQHPLDQSLRHGTQTSRSLLLDTDPAVTAILQAFQEPIAQYRARLGSSLGHPLSARNEGPIEFTGAWSVRLRRQGFHVNHFHPDGWLSSAYYVDVPTEAGQSTTKPGWLKLGEPRYPVPDAKPERFVQPVPGRLVLFPSYMWHGTNAIYGEEPRMSIAFDVRPKR